MRDWKAYADHLRALTEQDPAGVFVGADVVLELIEDRMEMLRAMIRIGTGGEICEYCEHVRYAEDCVEYECECEHCHHTCECRSCTNGSGFVWAGRKTEPAPEVVVTDDAPEDLAGVERRHIIVIDSDGTVSVRNVASVVEPSLAFLQSMVGGNIETIEFRAPEVPGRFVAVFDEEGKLKDLPANDTATLVLSMGLDYFVGTVLFLKIEGENIVTLTTDETKKLMDALDAEWEVQV